jgi:hypothetical protein
LPELHINQGKTKYMIMGWKKQLKNKNRKLTIINYAFEKVENFKYVGVILNEYNNYQIDSQERVKDANKIYIMLQKFLEIKIHVKN